MTEHTPKPIQLDQFLKLANVVQSGGEAKHLIQGGEVKLNGEVETRRKKKLHDGDIIEIFDYLLEVQVEDEAE